MTAVKPSPPQPAGCAGYPLVIGLTGATRCAMGRVSKAVAGLDRPARRCGGRDAGGDGRLAWVRVEMRQHSEAESLMRTVLEKRRAVLGKEHPATLEALSDIGVLYRRMGKHDAALPLLQQALSARRQLLGDDHPDTLQSMQYLGADC